MDYLRKQQVRHISWNVIGCCLLGSLSTLQSSPSALVPRDPIAISSSAAPPSEVELLTGLPHPLPFSSPSMLPSNPRKPQASGHSLQ